ncbi:hypothetical protein BJY52DRAFT_1214031, partial [Lactarius psammicola]
MYRFLDFRGTNSHRTALRSRITVHRQYYCSIRAAHWSTELGSVSTLSMDTQSYCPVSFAEPLLSIGSPNFHPLSLLDGPPSGATPHINKTGQCRCKKRKNVHAQDESYKQATTIDMLPDNVLLEIFDLCRRALRYNILPAWRWHLLVHVCQRWRQIVFESPRRLKLQILCTRRTPVRKNLGIWPTFPIVVDYRYPRRSNRPKGEGN